VIKRNKDNIKVVALNGIYSDSNTMGLIPDRAVVFLECRSIVCLFTFIYIP
jgi:hypothetical protein